MTQVEFRKARREDLQAGGVAFVSRDRDATAFAKVEVVEVTGSAVVIRTLDEEPRRLKVRVDHLFVRHAELH